MKETHMHHHTEKKSISRRAVLGSLFVVFALIISTLNTRLLFAARPWSVTAYVTLLLLVSLCMRVVFLFLSAQILRVHGRNWITPLFIVGTNAAVITTLALLEELTGFTGRASVLVSLGILLVCSLVVGAKAYKVTVFETVALYMLSLAMFLVGFSILEFFFHGAFLNLLSMLSVRS